MRSLGRLCVQRLADEAVPGGRAGAVGSRVGEILGLGATGAGEGQGQSGQSGGLSVQRVCRTSGPAMFSGRAKRENCELAVVQPRCKSSAPAMFSGRARTSNCEVEMRRPEIATYAPSIFSGRKARPASAYAPPQYSYVVAADGTATPQVTVQTREAAAKAEQLQPRRRLPSMFTGRRPKAPAAQPAQ